MKHGNAEGIDNCAWALAVLGASSPGFFSALERCLDKVVINANACDLCKVCYAIAVLDHVSLDQRHLLPVLWRCLLDRKIDDLPDEALAHIVYVQTFHRGTVFICESASRSSKAARRIRRFYSILRVCN